MVEPPPSENCLNMKLEVKYLFPTSSLLANVCIICLEMRKILAHGIRMQNNLQTRADIFWIFTDFHGAMRVHKSNLHPLKDISAMASITPKLSIKS